MSAIEEPRGIVSRFRMRFVCAAICGSILLIAGCSSVLAPRPDDSRFYVLTTALPSQSQAAAVSRHSTPLVIGLGPINLPAYLDREEMVTRVAPNQVRISERDFWAAPLSKSFSETLSENLSSMLGNARMVAFPWYPSTKLDYAVSVTVTRFEGQANGDALLVANWNVKDSRGTRSVYHRRSEIVEPVASGESTAAALSRALDTLSRQIATVIGEAA